jgi:hypothetical protein
MRSISARVAARVRFGDHRTHDADRHHRRRRLRDDRGGHDLHEVRAPIDRLVHGPRRLAGRAKLRQMDLGR